ncbi:hypothetical protein METP2_03184 [Methanosarcinales archaeon]|nr:COG1361 S-layer family protein [Candidatus Methanoperedens sp.]CAG0999912.1 hypothetical protein METP2_03184 [Methanosarcinales archaeon]
MVDIKSIFNIKYVIAAALAFILIITPVNAELGIVLDSLSPQPVEPGQDFVLSVTLSNENSDASDVMLTLLPDSYIILKNEHDRVTTIGNIIKYGAFTKTYQLHANSNAVSGSYEIDLSTRWLNNGQLRISNKTINVIVRGTPQLAISNITITPELISPLDTFDIAFVVSNEGAGISHDVIVSTVTEGLPFVTAGTDTKVIKTLDRGEQIQLGFRIMVKDKADISSYSIPVKMEYKDENGKNISSQSTVGVKVLGRAKLSVANIKTEPQNPSQGEHFTVTMRIENSGTGDAKSSKITFTTPLEGNKTAFLGKIKPNDDAPAIFTFIASESGNIPYSASVEFEDDLGIHTRTWELNQYVSGKEGNSLMAPVSIVAVVVAAIFYRFRWKKRAN